MLILEIKRILKLMFIERNYAGFASLRSSATLKDIFNHLHYIEMQLASQKDEYLGGMISLSVNNVHVQSMTNQLHAFLQYEAFPVLYRNNRTDVTSLCESNTG